MTRPIDIGLFTRARVDLVRQTELAECGLACLAMIAGYFGLNVDMAVMRRKFSPSNRGASLQTLVTVADKLDLNTRAVRVELEGLRDLALPAILHWDLNHYVVLEKFHGKKALIHDPASGTRTIQVSEISKRFTGIALEFEPTSSFEVGDIRERLKLSNLWSRIRGFKQAVFQTVLLSCVIQVFALVSPYYLQTAVDVALAEGNLGFLGVLALGFGLFSVLNGVSTLLRSFVLLAVGSSFGYGLSSNVARKLFRLPIDWFDRRKVGDILSRFQSVVPIRKMLSEDAPATLVDGILAVLTLCLMFVYSPLLASVSLFALSIYTLVKTILFAPQREAQEDMIVASGREQSVLIESVRGIRALRLAGRESMRHAVWQSRMTDAINGTVRFQRLANWQNALQITLFGIENVIVVWLAIRKVISGGFSIGMVFAFLAYKAQFLMASTSLISRFADFKMLGLHLERLADIALSQEAHVFKKNDEPQSVLRGEIELRDISFRYSEDTPYVLRGVNLKVAPGCSIAITGPSGGGKSTLLHILLGLAEPTYGEVLIDGVPLPIRGYRSYYSRIAAVLQDDTLFAGTLVENISLFDEMPDMSKVRESARLAAIDSDIEAMPMGFDTLVGEMGSALSGGQRQRVLLARALYRAPRILVMDEGTSHLDEVREREVNHAISAMGITRIIVAHRKETIASANQVFVLDDGVLREQVRDKPNEVVAPV